MRSALLLALVTALALFGCGSEADENPGGGGESGASGYPGVGGFGGSGGSSGGSGGATGGTGGAAGSSSGGSGGSTGGSGGSTGGSGGSTGGTGGTGGATCNDPGPEPNDTLPKATPICASPPCKITCSDSAGGTMTGVLSPGDVDLHTYFGEDKVTCVVNAVAKTADSGFRLCQFIQCADGKATTVTCKKGTATTGPGGIEGCCTTAPGEVETDHDCPGITDDDSAAVYVQVDQANACIGYNVEYHF